MPLIRFSDLSLAQQKFINIAAEVTERSPFRAITKRTGAIIVGNGSVLATGFNQYQDHYMTSSGCKVEICSLHAEVNAVLNYERQHKGFSQAKVAEEDSAIDDVCCSDY